MSQKVWYLIDTLIEFAGGYKKRAKYTGFTHNPSFDTPHVQVQHAIF